MEEAKPSRSVLALLFFCIHGTIHCFAMVPILW